MKRLTIEEYKQRVANVLFKVDEICKENNLRYMIAYGTLLGAIRHKGFIPWDDDVDIAMPREDYDKLREIIGLNKRKDICFIDIENSPDTIYMFGKVCDKQTTAKEKNFKKIKNYGAYIDIFPYYYLPDDPKKEKKLVKKSRRYLKIIQHGSRTGYSKTKSFKTNVLRFLAFYFCKLFNTQKMIRKITDYHKKTLVKNNSGKFGSAWNRFRFDFTKKEFDSCISVPFENGFVMAPKNYKKILTQMYGDYMKLPPIEERVSHNVECYLKK